MRRIAAHLATAGPTPGDELQTALGIQFDPYWRAIHTPWFDLTAKGWVLTSLGREQTS